MTNRTGVKSYRTALEYLETGRDPLYRKTEYETAIVTDGDGSPVVRLFDTHIVTYHEDGSVTLNSGGWHTVTTKRRMNDYQDVCYVYQDDNVWYVNTQGVGGWDIPEKERLVFEDGMRVYPDGTVKLSGNRGPSPSEQRDLAADVNKYAREIAQQVADGWLDWEGSDPQPTAEEIEEWMANGQYHARLVWAGAKARGMAALPYAWLGKVLGGDPLNDWEAGILRDNVYRGVRKYMRLTLGLPA